VGIRVASLSGRPDAALVAALDRAGGGSTGPRAWTPAERSSLLAEAARKGNPERGEAVFRREGAQCLKCHAIAGAGGRVGPGLESIGASAPVDYLLDSLVEPTKAVKEGYHATVVATADGRVLTGLKVRQTDSELVLRDSEDREISIPIDAIEEQKPAGSLMPAGLTDPMTRSEIIDLVRFLSELGKLGPYAVSPQSRFVRRWQVLEPPATIAKGAGVDPLDALATDPKLAWSPAYSRVAGDLPAEALATIPLRINAAQVGLARAELEVTTPGKVRLSLSPSPIACWLDGRRVGSSSKLDLDLIAGLHSLTFALPADPESPGFRAELQDVVGSPARAQAVVGK
jgi:putative heme-binding domain-containing protein